jgi:hypothetical protein
MVACLIQQLFRLKIGMELDPNFVDEAIFPLLLDPPRGIREKSKKLMVDINLMLPNAISIKGSIFGISFRRFWEWHDWEPGQVGQDYPEWTIHPFRVTGPEELDSPEENGPFPDEPWPDPEFLRCWPPRDIIYAAEHAEQAREGEDEPGWEKDPILWGRVRIVNYLRRLKHAQTNRDVEEGCEWIGLENTTDDDCEMDAWDRIRKLRKNTVQGTDDLLELASVKADIIREDNSFVNEFLEDSVLNLKKIYFNRVDDWRGRILVLSH